MYFFKKSKERKKEKTLASEAVESKLQPPTLLTLYLSCLQASSLGDRKEHAKAVLPARCPAAPSRGRHGHCICPEAVFTALQPPRLKEEQEGLDGERLVGRRDLLPERLGRLTASWACGLR